SMATPLVTGIVADLLAANPRLTHDDIKEILMKTARHYLPDDANSQGAGVIDPEAALNEALARAQGQTPPPPTPAPPPAPAPAPPAAAAPAMTGSASSPASLAMAAAEEWLIHR